MKKTAVTLLVFILCSSILMSVNLIKICPINASTFLTTWSTYSYDNGIFKNPTGVAVDGNGSVYVADAGNRRVEEFDNNGNFKAEFGNDTSGPQFNWPTGVAIDSSGNVYVSDWGNNSIVKFGVDHTNSSWGSSGTGAGLFGGPLGIAVNSSGYIYVLDSQYGVNARVEVFDNTGNFEAQFSGDSSGPPLYYSYDVAVDGSGNVYVPVYNLTLGVAYVVKFGVDHTNSTWGNFGTGSGQLYNPWDVAVDGLGYLYVTDTYNSRVEKFNSAGFNITEFGSYGTGDGQFRSPQGIAVDGSGNVFVADAANNRIDKFLLPNPLFSFVIGSASPVAGRPFNVTITAADVFGNAVTGYSGTVHFSSSDSLAALPSDYTFQTGDNGEHTFSVTFNATGSQTLNVWDKLAPSIFGSTSWNVLGLTVVNVETDIPPSSDWNYIITVISSTRVAPGTVIENFTLPAGGGNATFSDYNFTDGGVFNITATPKFGYTTAISTQQYDDYSYSVIGDFNATLHLVGNTSMTVTFTSSAMGALAVQSTNSAPPSGVRYSIPPLVPVPVQSTWNVDINNDNKQDLVLGKPMSILVNFTGVTLQSTDSVHVSVIFEGTQYTQTATFTALASDSIVYFPSIVPNTIGNDAITGTYSINSGGTVPLSTTSVTVKNTTAPSLYYAYLSKAGYGTESQTAYSQMVGNSSVFLNATYPVKNLTVGAPYAGIAGAGPGSKKDPFAGMRTDAMAVAQKAQLAMGGSAVGIAIGPNNTGLPDYFTYQGFPGGAGISFGPGCKGVVVLDGYYTAPSHETGHTYGLYYGMPEEYNLYPPNGQNASGVWAQNAQWRTGYDFMGLAPYKTLSLTWVNSVTYSMLFNQTRTIPNDPEILLAGGIIYANGTVDTSTLTWYHLQQGTPDTLIPGSYALQFLDANNNVIGTTSFAASFDVNIDPGISVGQNQIDLSSFGTVHTDAAPFVFATTYPQGTATVQIVNYTSPQGPPVVLTAVPVSKIVDYGTFTKGYFTDGDFNPIDSFECVFTPSTGSNYKMTATNPGTFYYNLKITNNSPTTSFTAKVNIPSDFVLKPPSPGASAVQIDGQLVTYQFSTGLLTVSNIQISQGQTITLTVHLDYSLKFQYGGPQPYTSTSQTTFAKGYALSATVNSVQLAPVTVAAIGKKVTAIGGFLIDTNGFPKGGLTVAATNSSGTTVGTSTSTSDGFYFITLPAAGTYKVKITNTLITPVGPVSNIKVVLNQFLEQDFNNLNPADPAITGFVKDGYSNGVSGVQVQLLNGKDSPVATTTTNLGGYYVFRFYQPGQYTVQISFPTGYSATTTSTTIYIKQFQTATINFSLKRNNP